MTRPPPARRRARKVGTFNTASDSRCGTPWASLLLQQTRAPTGTSRALSNTTARAVVYASWRKDILSVATKNNSVPLLPLDPNAVLCEVNPTAFYARLVGGLPATPLDLGDIKGITALNTPSPYGTSLAGLTTVRIDLVRAVLIATRGPSALFYWPFWTVNAHRQSGTSADAPLPAITARLALARATPPQTPEELKAARFKFMYKLDSCLLCGAAEHGPVHLCTDCTNPTIAAKRVLAMATFHDTVTAISQSLCTAHGTLGLSPQVLAHIAALDPSVGEGRFILGRLLLGAPWTPAMCTTPTTTTWLVAQTLAAFLSSIAYNGKMRVVADTWMLWAHKTLTAVCVGWHNHLTEDAHLLLVEVGFKHPFQDNRNAVNAALRKMKKPGDKPAPRGRRGSDYAAPAATGLRAAPARRARSGEPTTQRRRLAPAADDSDSSDAQRAATPAATRARTPRAAAGRPPPVDPDDDDEELPPREVTLAVVCGGPLVFVPGSTGIWGPPGTFYGSAWPSPAAGVG